MDAQERGSVNDARRSPTQLEHCPDERVISAVSPGPTRNTETRELRFQKVLPILGLDSRKRMRRMRKCGKP